MGFFPTCPPFPFFCCSPPFFFPLHKQFCLNSTKGPSGDELTGSSDSTMLPWLCHPRGLRATHPVFCLMDRAWHPGRASSTLFSLLHLLFSFTHPYFPGLLHPDQVFLPGRIYVGGLNLAQGRAGLSHRFPATEDNIRNSST